MIYRSIDRRVRCIRLVAEVANPHDRIAACHYVNDRLEGCRTSIRFLVVYFSLTTAS